MSAAQHGGTSKRTLAFLGLGFLALVGLVAVLYYYSESGFTPLSLESPPVFTRDEAGERVYLLTTHRETYRSAGHSRTRVKRSDQRVELWAIDPATARPLWRNRFRTTRDGEIRDRVLLGVHGDTIWILTAGKLVALTATNGALKASPNDLEALNPDLSGLMPTDPRYYTFDERGLHITTKDARTWLFNPDTLKASADSTETPAPEGAFEPVVFLHAGTWNHLSRGLDSPGHWVGLLTDEEAVTFEKNNALGGLTSDVRRRLWRARSHPPGNAYGALPDYYELTPLTGGLDFLDGGLLGEHNVMDPPPPFRLSAPDSVLVLHREHLGESGKLRLARVTTNEGNAVWETTLPLTVVQSVIPAEGTVVLFGAEFMENYPAMGDIVRNAPERLVSVNLETGATHVHSHTAFETYLAAGEVDLGF